MGEGEREDEQSNYSYVIWLIAKFSCCWHFMKIYVVDGDNIGNVIEAHTIRNEINALGLFSTKIVNAIEEIRKSVIEGNGTVIYCAGDNVMFLGNFDDAWCEKIIHLFYTITGCTASMGIGETAAETYLALRLAKVSGGGKVMHYTLSK